MIAKIVKGASFGGVCRYVLDKKKDAELLSSNGVRTKDHLTIAESFEMQANMNPRVAKLVCHISLSFSAVDQPSNELMTQVANEYLQKMGFANTQFVIVKHNDKEHPHLHIVANRIDNNGHTISDRNDRYRSEQICKQLTRKYDLYLASGNENVKRDRLREPDATKYRIYDALVKNVSLSKSWAELEHRLNKENVAISFKTKGSTSQVEGVRFTMNHITFNGSKVDRQFSYSKIDCQLTQNAKQSEVQKQTAPNVPIVDIGGLFDFQQHGTNLEEEEFQRLLKKKKKRQIKM